MEKQESNKIFILKYKPDDIVELFNGKRRRIIATQITLKRNGDIVVDYICSKLFQGNINENDILKKLN